MVKPLTRGNSQRNITSSSSMARTPGVPHRQLGRVLRAMRLESGLSILMAAKAIGRGSGTLQRLETGTANKISDSDIDSLCRLYRQPERASELKALAAQRMEQSWWDEYTDQVAPSFGVYLGLESAAESVTIYRPDIVSGLFQTREYAEALDRLYFVEDLPEERERRLRVRRERQNLILRTVAPLQVDLVIDQGVLRRVVHGPRVMARQCRHLADLPPNVSVRVLPDTAGYPVGTTAGPFTILDFGTDSEGKALEPPVVYIESYAGSIHLERPDSVRRYRNAFQKIQRVALDRTESKHLLRRVAKEYAP
ncbi:helix-turn-helix domain-containing protein [Nocardia araoensis]|uniref:helix-turn-helix domain-containing protein n=1 Tax=Nocardia araoensis TaxID=228600 RepID=UPI0002F0A183|nr:helix-turn-helix transcriptional regulator [Nocardia araoensis]